MSEDMILKGPQAIVRLCTKVYVSYFPELWYASERGDTVETSMPHHIANTLKVGMTKYAVNMVDVCSKESVRVCSKRLAIYMVEAVTMRCRKDGLIVAIVFHGTAICNEVRRELALRELVDR